MVPTVINTLSLHDALPIYDNDPNHPKPEVVSSGTLPKDKTLGDQARALQIRRAEKNPGKANPRSEEHTSELQSRFDLVCRLLLEKKKAAEGLSLDLLFAVV